MRVVRLVAALITSVGLAFVGGCGSGSEGGGVVAATGTAAPAAQAPTDPKEQLVAGIRTLNTVPHRIATKTVTGTVTNSGEGAADPARRAARLTTSQSAAGSTGKTDAVVVGTDVYIRFDVAALPGIRAGRWAHVDGRRLKSLRALGLGSADDPSGKLAMVDTVTTIERTGAREVRGTLDLTKGPSLLPDAARLLGEEARQAPWQARFDAQGRLEWLSVTVPTAGDVSAMVSETTYSAFGEPVSVERPPARDTIEAPESLYKLFGGG